MSYTFENPNSHVLKLILRKCSNVDDRDDQRKGMSMSSGRDTNRNISDESGNPDGADQTSPNFTFHNIGPIAQADLELGDLTVIAGRNNTGKTYLVYTLYGFLKMSRQTARFSIDYGPEFMDGTSAVDNITESLLTSGQARYAIDEQEFNKSRETLLEHVARSFSEEGLAGVFSHNKDAFRGASIEVHLPSRKPSSSGHTEIHLPSGGIFSIHYDGKEIVAAVDKVEASRTIFEIQHGVAMFFFDFLLGDLPYAPFILSAERFGISLFYRELDFTKNKLVDMLQRMRDDKDKTRFSPFLLIDSTTSRYALPIKDNIDYTRSIPDLKAERSQFYDDKLFDDIKEMMDGYYSNSDGDIRFISKARKGRTFNIPLHLASSSARGLSDLYFFLRHVARRNQLLIVDEPESHLDTANQRQMARLLARFVRAGIKVLITTHSDYLIKEFNNLIMLSSPIENRDAVARKLGYLIDDSLPLQSVRAYVAERDSLKRCKVDQFGIDMPVFDISIDQINHVANELVSRVEENA